ncbi:hypothetical protein CPAR01_12798 [Colletotrichum paranaense]|uniref:Uncharacterized protein n=1 Tax=Colletotrichum paranaense TaxID=1914294 RepID=A0ABQ9S7H1_9PEZI|nr:uncharacterized protein CPAR01_12798 [Colletotrichum paranaense]KAK1528240.1 hypothetical protein CPAR01_12798 [Colletotrichum paranaense]
MSGLIESIKAHWSRVPCGGCGSVYPKLCFSVRDQRCANRKEVLTIAADCEVAIAERENINDRVEAFKQDEDRLHETLAREDVYIKSLEVALEEARNRRRKTCEEHNTRWADFTKNFDGHRDMINKSGHLVNRLHEAMGRMYALNPRRFTDHSLEDHDRSEENKENIGPRWEICSITPSTYLASDDMRPSGGESACMTRNLKLIEELVSAVVTTHFHRREDHGDKSVAVNGIGTDRTIVEVDNCSGVAEPPSRGSWHIHI